MNLRVRYTRRLNIVVALVLGGAASIAGPSACKPSASTQAGAAAVPYPPQKPIEIYQQDPAWKHRVGVIDVRPPQVAAATGPAAPAPAAEGSAAVPPAPSADLATLLEQAGFTVARLGGAPPDGGEYNTVVEIGQQGTQLVIGARMLTPDARGSYEQVAPETENDLYVRVVASLEQVLQPTPPPPAVEEPPPPDPKEVCKAECAAKQEPCARACCEKGLGADPVKCDGARDGATRCLSECAEKAKDEADAGKKAKKIADCEDGCRRGKHSAYPWNPKIARNSSFWAKCVPTCTEEHDACVQACDAPPPEPAAPAEGAAPHAAPAAPAAPAAK